MSKYSVNLLALPKAKKFMRVFKAPPGFSLVQADITALEPHVLTYFSKDPTLYKIYGEGASPYHDVYFAAGMRIPGLGDRIREHYDLEAPTAEGKKYLKATLGEERSKKLKPSYLGWIYGIGPHTLATNLDLTVSEARVIIEGMNRQFPGRDNLHRRLITQWKRTGGWITSARGTPICVDFKKTKDLVNRLVQKSGHEILQRMMWHISQYRKQHSCRFRAYIPDWHDEGIYAVPKGYEDEVIDALSYGQDRINDELGWDVTIKFGGFQVGGDLSIRCEED